MPLPDLFEFWVRPRILFGAGVVRELAFEAAKVGGTRAVLVTDQVLRRAGLAERVTAGLSGGSVTLAGVYDDVPPNSEVGAVERGAAFARELGCDLLIALGGGSVIDTAKGMSILLTEGGSLLDHEGAGLLNRPLMPLIAIPTTAGTGSEVTIAAVIKDNARGLKLEFSSPYLQPVLAMLDPELTVSMPPGLTAATGMDALTHAIEAYVSAFSSPISDALALHAIRVVSDHLLRAVRNGSDLDARGNMLLASTIAGMSFSNALCGIVHAMAHACGGRYSVPHGLANSILLPFGMEFNQPAVTARLADVAVAMGVPASATVGARGFGDDEMAARGIAAVRALSQACGLPQRLSLAGVQRDGFAQLANDASGDAMMISNPRPATEDEIVALFEEAY